MNHYHNGGIQYVKYLIHTFCVYVFVLCVLVVLFRHWALKWVMVPDRTGLYVRLVGWCDIHCKFLSTLRGCVLPNESVCLKCRLRMDICQTYGVCNYALYCFWMVFCPHILSFVSCINYNIFYHLWDQYTDSIVPLAYMPVWCCACYIVRFDLSVNYLSYFVSTWCSHLCQSYLWWAFYLL